MCLNYLFANVKSKAGSGDCLLIARPVETIENEWQGLIVNAGAMVMKCEAHIFPHLSQSHINWRTGCILDRVREQVLDHLGKPYTVSLDGRCAVQLRVDFQFPVPDSEPGNHVTYDRVQPQRLEPELECPALQAGRTREHFRSIARGDLPPRR